MVRLVSESRGLEIFQRQPCAQGIGHTGQNSRKKASLGSPLKQGILMGVLWDVDKC